jgi:hypothetical protein
MENRLLENLKIELPHDPAVPLLGKHMKECEVSVKTPALPYLLQHYS